MTGPRRPLRIALRQAGFAALALAAATCAATGPAAAQSTFNLGPGLGGGVFNAPVTSLRDMPFRTVVRQQFDYSCGSAALATLLHYHYGRPIDEAQVFKAMYAIGDQVKIRQLGFSLLDMKRYLSSVGLAADGYRETLDELLATPAPAIAVIQLNGYRHFVVVKGAEAGKVLVGDPALGLRTYGRADFGKVWNGVVFRIHPDGAGSGQFNRKDEWATFPHASASALADRDLAQFTRGLPPLYQITLTRTAP